VIKFLERFPEFRVATDVWWNALEDYPKEAVLTKYANFFGTPYVAGGLGNPEVIRDVERGSNERCKISQRRESVQHHRPFGVRLKCDCKLQNSRHNSLRIDGFHNSGLTSSSA
jgi:hypothetical protein